MRSMHCFAYQYGHGVEVDLEKAIDLLMKAAMQGQSEAQNRIGNAYRSGEGVRQNHTAAYNWYNGPRCLIPMECAIWVPAITMVMERRKISTRLTIGGSSLLSLVIVKRK